MKSVSKTLAKGKTKPLPDKAVPKVATPYGSNPRPSLRSYKSYQK
jgi:hypothetical protein